MSLISQLLSASYPAVIQKRAANQWAESAFMNALQKGGFIKTLALGGTIEAPLDYQMNAGAQVLATDLTATSTAKTDILTAASYGAAAVSVPIVWSKQDDAQTEDQKVPFVSSLIDNAIESHDYLIEQTLFVGSNGLLGLDTIATEDGTGTIGGIVAGTYTWWKNAYKDYTDASALLADLGTCYNASMKGSGSQFMPKLIVTSAASHGVYEGKLQANQRYVDSKDATGGFVNLAFKTAQMVFSPAYTSDSYYFLNNRNYQIRVSNSMFRFKDKETPLEAAEGYKTSIFSVLQAVTNNRSRLGVAFT